jgi:dipeptidyl aminopeptidase/acylaminoacyl peptidase
MQNFNRWGVNNPERYKPVYEAYGTPDENPEFWSNLSAELFYENVNDPILILHGTLDDTCDIAWSEKATSEMQALGKDVELITYRDGHAFGPYWTQSMVATVEFLNEHLN